MKRHVASTSDGYRVVGPGGDVELANQFLAYLRSRAFSPATVRAYAYDLLNFLRTEGLLCAEKSLLYDLQY
jgi:hypothetical protein